VMERSYPGAKVLTTARKNLKHESRKSKKKAKHYKSKGRSLKTRFINISHFETCSRKIRKREIRTVRRFIFP